jgi:hypothetical protein
MTPTKLPIDECEFIRRRLNPSFEQELSMPNSQVFDYDQPTRDSLAGIYVEATDGELAQGGSCEAGSPGRSAPQMAALFGLTVTVDDSANAMQSNGPPASRGLALPDGK